ncbi:MAG: dihydrolipoyl dehydrogenase [Limisphaerales bacterium]
MEPIKTEIVVIGAGPGGYAAAFYAADRGKKVVLIEREDRLGGVCLNRGCIPSKTLLNAAHAVSLSREAAHWGVTFAEPTIDLDRLRAWKESILERLAGGIVQLAQRRKVRVLHGRAHLEGANSLRVETSQGQQFVEFEHAILATGSKPSLPKSFDLGNPRIMTSTEALEVEEIPKRLLVIGGGYIGMELGTVYSTFGSEVVVVEAADGILTGSDPDLSRPIAQRAAKNFKEIRVKARVLGMSTKGAQIKVDIEHEGQKLEELYDRVLVSVGRVPNCDDMGLENTKVTRDEKGFVAVDDTQRTEEPSIYAIGDVAGGVLLAHKATREARIAVEAILGEHETIPDFIIPAVVFTDPELAWCGLTEAEAREKGITVEVAKFPWAASGRALTYGRPDGMTKLLIDPETERVLGVGIVGHGAGELIAEGVVAMEMGATAKDLALSVHPHPTLSETLMECAEVFYGHATHTLSRKRPS